LLERFRREQTQLVGAWHVSTVAIEMRWPGRRFHEGDHARRPFIRPRSRCFQDCCSRGRDGLLALSDLSAQRSHLAHSERKQAKVR
jgi:hypothetical protein